MEATIFHEIVIYRWKELQTHLSLNDIMGGLSKQQAILHRLGVAENQEDTEKATESVVSNIMDRGYFGFLRGLTRNVWQIWTFCVCLYVTMCVILVHCCPLTGIPAGLNLPNAAWNFVKRRREGNELSERELPNEEVPLATAPPLLRRWSREADLAVPNRYVSPLELPKLSTRPLKAIQPPTLKSFSASQGHLAEEPRVIHHQYPSLPAAAREFDVDFQPFRVNAIYTLTGSPKEARAHLSEQQEIVISIYLEKMKVQALVDTGSCFTHVPQRVAEMLRNQWKPSSITASSITGHQLKIVGEVESVIRMAGIDIQGRIVVTDASPYDLVLGTDVLRHFGTVQLDFASKRLKVGKKNIPCDHGNGTGGVFLCQQIRIPPKTRALVMGLCYGLTPDQLRNRAECCFAPSEKLLRKYDVVSKPPLVTPCEKLVPVILCNNDNAPKYLPERATLGMVQPLSLEEGKMIAAQDETKRLVIIPGKPRNREEMQEFLAKLQISPMLAEGDQSKLRSSIAKYETLFARNDYDLGQTTLVEHGINTGDAQPIRQPPYRTPHSLRPLMYKKIEQMLAHGIIQPSQSNWSSPALMVNKSDSEDMRFCVDNRKLNDVTVKDNYPMKQIEEALDILYGAESFVVLDLQSGYYQVPVKELDRHKTAFATHDGLFEFTKMNFGLCNAPATFQRLMDQVLRGLDLKICMSYIDDIIIPASSIDQLTERMEAVFERLLAAGLKLKSSKCKFGMTQLKFLGFVVSNEGLKPDPAKIEKILEAVPPQDRTQLQSFLGFAGWCKRFIKAYAHIAEPLTNLLQKTKAFRWSAAAQTAFDLLKSLYVNPPILIFPNLKAPFVICTDASSWAIGAVLCQKDEEDKERPISYDSRVLNKCERKYSTVEREMLAVFWSVTKKYRVYVYGNRFTVFTDHKPLLGVWKSPPNDGRLGKWCLRMQEYRPNMILQYREGKANVVADYLSRLPGNSSPIVAAVVNQTEEVDEETREMQLKDSVFGPIMAYKEHGVLPEDVRRAEKVPNWAKTYEMVNGVLHKRSDRFQKLLFAVPVDMRPRILIANHDRLLGGHMGVRKTLSKIQKKYFWPGYYRDVVSWCRSCLLCQTRKNPARLTKVPMKPIAISHINQKWAWDICGKLPLSRQGNRYILVCLEYFTKFPELFAVPDTKAERLAKIFVEKIVLRYGCPEVLISDQGANVHSGMIQEICKLLDIEKLRTSAYHPQSDGMVERFNRTLQNMISMYVNDGHTDWCEFLPFMEFAYRASVHESTRESPFFLMYGYDPRLPIDMTGMPSNMRNIDCEDDYKLYVLSKLLESRRVVADVIPTAQMKQKEGYDRKATEHAFMEGDRVLVYTPVTKEGRSRKFARCWKGPYRITKVSMNGANLEVEAIGRKRNQKRSWIHANRAKRVTAETGVWPFGPEGTPSGTVCTSSTQEKATKCVPALTKEVCNKCKKRRSTSNKWVACDACEKWFHFECVGLEEAPTAEEWICSTCSGTRNEGLPQSQDSANWPGQEAQSHSDTDESVATVE